MIIIHHFLILNLDILLGHLEISLLDLEERDDGAILFFVVFKRPCVGPFIVLRAPFVSKFLDQIGSFLLLRINDLAVEGHKFRLLFLDRRIHLLRHELFFAVLEIIWFGLGQLLGDVASVIFRTHCSHLDSLFIRSIFYTSNDGRAENNSKKARSQIRHDQLI